MAAVVCAAHTGVTKHGEGGKKRRYKGKPKPAEPPPPRSPHLQPQPQPRPACASPAAPAAPPSSARAASSRFRTSSRKPPSPPPWSSSAPPCPGGTPAAPPRATALPPHPTRSAPGSAPPWTGPGAREAAGEEGGAAGLRDCRAGEPAGRRSIGAASLLSARPTAASWHLASASGAATPAGELRAPHRKLGALCAGQSPRASPWHWPPLGSITPTQATPSPPQPGPPGAESSPRLWAAGNGAQKELKNWSLASSGQPQTFKVPATPPAHPLLRRRMAGTQQGGEAAKPQNSRGKGVGADLRGHRGGGGAEPGAEREGPEGQDLVHGRVGAQRHACGPSGRREAGRNGGAGLGQA